MRGARAIRRVADRAVLNANQPRNVDKGDWHDMSRKRLCWLLVVEAWELVRAVWVAYCALRDYGSYMEMCGNRYDGLPEYHQAAEQLWARVKETRRHVEHEAGDCVAFAAFIADRV